MWVDYGLDAFSRTAIHFARKLVKIIFVLFTPCGRRLESIAGSTLRTTVYCFIQYSSIEFEFKRGATKIGSFAIEIAETEGGERK